MIRYKTDTITFTGKAYSFSLGGEDPCPQGTQKRSGSIRRQKEEGKPEQSLRVASAGGTGEAELVSSKHSVGCLNKMGGK